MWFKGVLVGAVAMVLFIIIFFQLLVGKPSPGTASQWDRGCFGLTFPI